MTSRIGPFVVELMLKSGPMHAVGIARTLNRDYSATVPVMTALRRSGQIVVVGKAKDYGFTDVVSTAPVYDVVRTAAAAVQAARAVQLDAKAAAAALPPPPEPPPQRARTRTKSGSGVIAGPITIGSGFRWGSSRW